MPASPTDSLRVADYFGTFLDAARRFEEEQGDDERLEKLLGALHDQPVLVTDLREATGLSIVDLVQALTKALDLGVIRVTGERGEEKVELAMPERFSIVK